MPLSADPNRTVEFWLKCDADTPIEKRQVFVCRYMGYGEHLRIRELLKKADALPSGSDNNAECYRLIMEVIGIGVVDWKNFPWEFSLDTVGDKLDEMDLWELAVGYPLAVRASKVDLKKSIAPSESTETEGASVATVPATAK